MGSVLRLIPSVLVPARANPHTLASMSPPRCFPHSNCVRTNKASSWLCQLFSSLAVLRCCRLHVAGHWCGRQTSVTCIVRSMWMAFVEAGSRTLVEFGVSRLRESLRNSVSKEPEQDYTHPYYHVNHSPKENLENGLILIAAEIIICN